jgi:hypothetical protein
MVESREEEQPACVLERGRVWRTRLRIGVRRQIDDPYLPSKVNSRWKKEPSSQIAGKEKLHTKELETPNSTKEDEREHLRIFNGFPPFFPSHYRPSRKKTLKAHGTHALTPLVVRFLFLLFLVFLLRVVSIPHSLPPASRLIFEEIWFLSRHIWTVRSSLGTLEEHLLNYQRWSLEKFKCPVWRLVAKFGSFLFWDDRHST